MLSSSPKIVSLLSLFALGTAGIATGYAQTKPVVPAVPVVLPALGVSSPVVGADGSVTLSLPAPFPLNNTRWRIGIWEHGRAAYLGDVIRDFTVRDGGLRATIRVEGDPGVYDLRLLTNDKRGAALTQPARIIVPGIRREPGWWLFNGSPFVMTSHNPWLPGAPWFRTAPGSMWDSFDGGSKAPGESVLAPAPAATGAPGAIAGAPTPVTGAPAVVPNAPLFVPGLKRNLNAKPKELTSNIKLALNGPVLWRVLPLPIGAPVQDLVKPDYDFGALRSRLVDAIAQARTRGDGNYIGVSLGADWTRPGQLAGAPATIGKVRGILGEVAPDAALILSLNVSSGYQDGAINTIEAFAPLVDAVLLVSNTPALWTAKAIRRVVEEQPNYDLPIFVQLNEFSAGSIIPIGQRQFSQREKQELLDYWMSGATGFVMGREGEAPEWAEMVQRNATLFVGSVTLEDVGLLPSPVTERPVNEQTDRLYQALRGAQRIPLLARTDNKSKIPESFAVPLGEKIGRDDIGKLRSAASGGSRIYCEGTPVTDNAEDAASLASLLGGTFKRDLAEDVAPKAATMTLEDTWLFGLARGRQLPVQQRGVVAPIPGKLSGQAKAEKGKDVLTEPRVVARLADGTPALIVNPVGKGEVLWLPHRIAGNLSSATSGSGASPGSPQGAGPANAVQSMRIYYSAVGAYLQPALVQVRLADAKADGADKVRVALRSSAKGTLLVALLNSDQKAVEVATTLNARAGVAIDLADDKEVPVDRRGNHSTMRLTIPAGGWRIIAVAATRKEFDTERNAKRLTARLK